MANKKTSQAAALRACISALEQYRKSTAGVMIPDATYCGDQAVVLAKAVLGRLKRENDRETKRIQNYLRAQTEKEKKGI